MAQNDDNQREQPAPPDRDQTLNTNRTAVAKIIRDDIDRLYDNGDTPVSQAEETIRSSQPVEKIVAPVIITEQGHENHESEIHGEVAEQWKKYHSSWQSYYQQYYERYYINHLHDAKSNNTIASLPSPEDDSSAHDQAVDELREKLIGTVKKQAKTARKSRHFAPIATATIFALAFLFLQFNRVLFATVQAYVSPGSINPQNVIVDQAGNTPVGKEPKLVIPKINVEAPVIYGANPADNNEVEEKLRSGVVHYPISNASSSPGQNGATVILGHSSNDVFDNGAYKFVFVQLSKLEIGDTFYINHEGIRYTYSITEKEIIDPRNVGRVTADPTKPTAILITCEPPGTALKRLLVFADQVSPDPNKSLKAPERKTSDEQKTTTIQGNSPTFIERMFGAR